MRGDFVEPLSASRSAQSNGKSADLEIETVELGSLDDELIVPITPSSEDMVAGLEMHLTYDSERLEFVGTTSGLVSEPIVNVGSDEIHIIWADIENAIPASEGEIALDLMFRVKTPEFERTEVSFDGVSVADLKGSAYRVMTTDGAIHNGRSEVLPREFELEQNFPNPFNPATTIRFSLPNSADVTLTVYNMRGQRAMTLIDRHMDDGKHSVIWDGMQSDGQPAASGIYFYRIVAEQFTTSKKLVLLK